MPVLLLVEDEPRVAAGLTITLKAEGFQVTWVNDGTETIPTWGRLRPDLILLDLMPPAMRRGRLAARQASHSRY